MGIIGIEPDITRARQWYERAAELGSPTASQELARLQRCH
jgi:TPR repeat protein